MNSRSISIDALRLPAAIGIVWLHTASSPQLQPTAILGRFTVPFFIAVAVFFIFIKASNQRHSSESSSSFLYKKVVRILIPFVFWSVFYWLVRYANCNYISNCQVEPLALETLWTGTTHHLWFLPVLFLVSITAFPVAHWSKSSNRRQWAVVVLALAAGFYLAQRPLPFNIKPLGYTPELFFNAAPAALWSAVISLAYIKTKPQQQVANLLACSAISLFSLSIAVILSGRGNILIENMSGIFLLLFAIYTPKFKLFYLLAPYGTYAYGLYLIHIFFIEGFQDVSAKFLSTETWLADLIIFAFATVSSLLVTIALRKVPVLSKYAGA